MIDVILEKEREILEAIAALSLVSSLVVVITPLVFERMRHNFFLRIICIISFCNLMFSVSMLFDVKRDAAFCRAQAVINTFFYIASWSWGVNLQMQLYGIIKYKKPIMQEYQIHIVFWLIPLLVFFIPQYAGLEYGPDNDDDEERIVCYIASSNTSGAAIIYGFQIFLYTFISILVSTYFYFNTRKVINEYPSEEDKRILSSMLNGVSNFAVAHIILWIPNLIAQVVTNEVMTRDSRHTSAGFFILANLQGFILSFIFFLNSREARFRWYQLITQFTLDNSIMMDENSATDSDVQMLQDILDFSGHNVSQVNLNSSLLGSNSDISAQSFASRSTVPTQKIHETNGLAGNSSHVPSFMQNINNNRNSIRSSLRMSYTNRFQAESRDDKRTESVNTISSNGSISFPVTTTSNHSSHNITDNSSNNVGSSSSSSGGGCSDDHPYVSSLSSTTGDGNIDI